MRLRDANYRAYDAVFLLEGVRDNVVDLLGHALIDLLRGHAGKPLRRSWPSGRRLTVRSAVQRASAVVRTADEELSGEQLIIQARRNGYVGLPISVTTSGERVAVSFAHAIADGGGMVVLLRALLTYATGAVPPVVEGAPVRFALLRAVLAAGPRNVLTAWKSHPEVTVPAVMVPAPSARQAALQDARMLRLRLDPDRLDRIRRAKRGRGRGRATLSTRVASLALAALQTTAHDEKDVRVAVPVDLRHLVGGQVDGNFIATSPLGGLLSTDWTPSRISEGIAALSGVPGLSTVLRGTIRGARSRLHRPGPWRERAITVSMLSSDRFPDEVWRDTAAPSLSCAAMGPWPSAVFVFVLFAGSEAFLSVWDEDQAVDLDRFEVEFEAELARREQTAA